MNHEERIRRKKALREYWEATHGPYPADVGEEVYQGRYPAQCHICGGMYVHSDGYDQPEQVRRGTRLYAQKEADYFLCDEHYAAWTKANDDEGSPQ